MNKKVDKKEKEHEDDVDIIENYNYNDDGISEEAQKKIKKIKERMAVCLVEKQEYLNGWQRAKADLVNERREMDAGRARAIKFSNEMLLLDFLPVLDSFDMAFSNKEAWESVNENWRKGVEHIYAQINNVLEQNNLSQINPIGEMFDPGLHTSVEAVLNEDPKKVNSIASVVQKGYKLYDKVIRPAKVKVFVKIEK